MRRFWIAMGVLAALALFTTLRTRDLTEHPLPVVPAGPPPVTTSAPTPPTHPDAVTRIDSRSIRLDDTFEITGAGSPTDPFKISWPLLMSPQRVDDPTAAVDLPASIKALDGATIEISGYLAPPVAVDETKELLVLKNRWDGCCIGTPPTPYDCIEVALAEPVRVRGKHLIQYGSVRGRLRVDPYLAGKFLLGLYRLEDAQVSGFGD